MKDYRLSEIMAHCKKMHELETPNGSACERCKDINFELFEFCENQIGDYPIEFVDIEPRDMIELPHKEFHRFYNNLGFWYVFFRKKDGTIGFDCFKTEKKADALLKELNGDNA